MWVNGIHVMEMKKKIRHSKTKNVNCHRSVWVTTTSTSLSCFKTKTNHHFLLTGNIDSVINVFVYYMYYIVGCSQTSNQSHCRSLGIFFKISLKICILFSQMLNDKMFCVRKNKSGFENFRFLALKLSLKV